VSFRSFTLPEFWKCYDSLPGSTRALADAKYALFEQEPFHPSLGLKQKGEVLWLWGDPIAQSRTAPATRSTGFRLVLTRPMTSSYDA
jgi:hypothetical protein